MIEANIHYTKTHLSRLARRIRAGETVLLCDRNKPFAEIRPLPKARTATRKLRPLGLYAGRVIMAPDFDSPETNRAVASLFNGAGNAP